MQSTALYPSEFQALGVSNEALDFIIQDDVKNRQNIFSCLKVS
jgi:hypothetical protein